MSEAVLKNIVKLKPTDIMKCVKSYLNTESDIVIGDCQIKPASDGLLGFQGEYYKMMVNVKINDEERQLYFFIKSLPSDEEKANKLNEAGYFRRESSVYREILSRFKYKAEHLKFHPTFLNSTQSDIVLEDLSKEGYIVTNQRNILDYNHTIIALTSLARFHAASLTFEEMNTNENGSIYRIENEFNDILDECGYKFMGWYKAGVDAVLEIAYESKLNINTSDFQSKCYKTYQEVLDLCGPSNTSRNVLSHRDLWANNLMFKYDQQGDPVQCIFIDYQACRCMPPAGDVMSLIYLNSSQEVRKSNMDDYLRQYYYTLTNELRENNIEDLLNWDEFKRECEVYKKWALGQATILLQMALLETKVVEKLLENPDDYERIINVSRKDIVLQTVKSDSVYRERMMSLVEEFIVCYVIEN